MIVVKSFKNIDEDKIASFIMNFILITNYYYTTIDRIRDTRIYSQKLLYHLKQSEIEMNRISKDRVIVEFFKIAGVNQTEDLNNSEEIRNLFFNKLSEMKSQDLEQFMIDFISDEK
jgi:hypothetical protein